MLPSGLFIGWGGVGCALCTARTHFTITKINVKKIGHHFVEKKQENVLNVLNN